MPRPARLTDFGGQVLRAGPGSGCQGLRRPRLIRLMFRLAFILFSCLVSRVLVLAYRCLRPRLMRLISLVDVLVMSHLLSFHHFLSPATFTSIKKRQRHGEGPVPRRDRPLLLRRSAPVPLPADAANLSFAHSPPSFLAGRMGCRHGVNASHRRVALSLVRPGARPSGHDGDDRQPAPVPHGHPEQGVHCRIGEWRRWRVSFLAHQWYDG